MKTLTALTVVFAVPTLIGSLWGMNVPVPFQNSPWGFAITVGISLVLALGAALVMMRKNMFK